MSAAETVDVWLYGAPASLYTAKVRAALRAQRIAHIERMPSHPRYRQTIKPQVDSHRIPAVEFADGEVLQDSTLILDRLEARFPDPVQAGLGPRQRLITGLMELVGDRGLSKPACGVLISALSLEPLFNLRLVRRLVRRLDRVRGRLVFG